MSAWKSTLNISNAIVLASIFFGILITGCTQERVNMPSIEKGTFAFITDRDDSLLVQGDSVTVFFHAPGEGTEQITGWFNREYGNTKTFKILPDDGDTMISGKIQIPDDAIGIFVYAKGQGTCYSGNLIEDYAEIHRPDGSPSPGMAFQYGLNKDYENFDRHIEREFEHFPNNAMAYTNRWYGFDSRGWADSLKAEMVKIRHMQGPDRLAALATGYAHLGEPDSAFNYLRQYLDTDIPKWGPTVISHMNSMLDYSNHDQLDLVIKAASANMEDNYAAQSVAPYLLTDNPKPDQRLEELFQKNMEYRPNEGYILVNYLRDVKGDTAQAFEAAKTYLSFYRKGDFEKEGTPVDRMPAEAFVWAGGEAIRLAEFNVAKEFAEAAEEISDKDMIQGQAALLKARIAHREGEDFEKYLTIAIARGQLSEVQSLQSELPVRNDITALFDKALEYSKKAPDYSFVDSAGVTIRPGNGEVQLLHFWGPGCKPCLDEKPDLEDFAKSMKGARFFAITNYPEDYITEHNLKFRGWENIYNKDIFGAFGIMSIPRTYIVDGDGYVRLVKFEATGDYGDEELVIRLLAQKIDPS